MARKKKSDDGADAVSTTTTTTEETKAPAEPMVSIVKTATAAKLSPRGGGELTYQVGRMGDTVLLRIHKNTSSGRFSAEWVTADALRESLAQLPKGTTSFKGAVALRSAWKGLSSCNSGFGSAILRAEKVFSADPDPKKKGMLTLASPEALDTWEAAIRALPIPKDAEQAPLHPPKAKPFFAKKKEDAAAAPGAEDAPTDDSVPVDAEPVGAVGTVGAEQDDADSDEAA